MFVRHIIGTIGTRIIGAAVGLMLLVLHAQFLGDTGLGTVALVVLGVSLSTLLAHVMGGGVLVYFAPRASVPKLLLPSYLWAIGSLGVSIVGLELANLIPEGYAFSVAGIAFLEILATNHQSILIGKERIHEANAAFVVRTILLGAGVICGIFVFEIRTAHVYVYAALIANLWWAASTFFFLQKELREAKALGDSWSWDAALAKRMLRLGGISQGGNAIQLMNYRLDIYLIEAFFPTLGLAMVGRYAAANQVGEGIWIVPRAIASVQYSRIANTDDKGYARRLSFKIMAMCMALATFGVALLLLIPTEGFVWLLGERFSETGRVLLCLAPGIIFWAGSIPLSPYFSGRGKHAINTWSAGVGLVATIIFGLWLIPELGVVGAAITSSISYGLSWGFQLVMVLRD
ncbi:MAG: lipopolysaccharide biosynthesis protein [Bacteroidia bacterium]